MRGALLALGLATAASIVPTWRVTDAPSAVPMFSMLGPFPVSKNELDGNPAGDPAAVWAWLNNGKRASRAARRSEYLEGGLVPDWQLVKADRTGALLLDAKGVDWQGLVSGMNGHELLEWQAVLATLVEVPAAHPAVTLSCSGVGAMFLDRRDPTSGRLVSRPLAGSSYFGQERLRTSVRLEPGRYALRVRVRVKHRAQLLCRAFATPGLARATTKPEMSAKFVPDWLKGHGPLGGIALLGIDLRNPTADWLTISAAVDAKFGQIEPSAPVVLAPGQAMVVPVRVRPTDPSGRCPMPFSVQLAFSTRASLNDTQPTESGQADVKVALRCRRKAQSVLATLEDVDGSVQHVAVVTPPANLDCAEPGCPVLLTLHGTSITASDSADAFKVMEPGDKEYRFGWAHGWLLAPSRHGAHNWEGIGRLHALGAVEWLARVSRSLGRPAGADRLVVAGHSMGGHGAWLFGLHQPERVVCLNANAGWIRKEQYGDSNKLFLHDSRLEAIDARLQYILQASVVENMVCAERAWM